MLFYVRANEPLRSGQLKNANKRPYPDFGFHRFSKGDKEYTQMKYWLIDQVLLVEPTLSVRFKSKSKDFSS